MRWKDGEVSIIHEDISTKNLFTQILKKTEYYKYSIKMQIIEKNIACNI